MQRYWLGVLLAGVLCGCSGQKKAEQQRAWHLDSLVNVEDSMLLIHLVYPVWEGDAAVADSVNTAVRDNLQSLLNGGDTPLGTTLQASVDSVAAQKRQVLN